MLFSWRFSAARKEVTRCINAGACCNGLESGSPHVSRFAASLLAVVVPRCVQWQCSASSSDGSSSLLLSYQFLVSRSHSHLLGRCTRGVVHNLYCMSLSLPVWHTPAPCITAKRIEVLWCFEVEIFWGPAGRCTCISWHGRYNVTAWRKISRPSSHRTRR